MDSSDDGIRNTESQNTDSRIQNADYRIHNTEYRIQNTHNVHCVSRAFFRMRTKERKKLRRKKAKVAKVAKVARLKEKIRHKELAAPL